MSGDPPIEIPGSSEWAMLDDENQQLRKEIERLRAENQRLENNWLVEQKGRLEQSDFLEMYSAAKAKVEIERLQTEIRHWQTVTQASGTHRSCTCAACERLMGVEVK